eukprot:TRINITY_DN2531_c0_g1_i1.p1 TRINITY_DN2531_c0_g1~~TRINITY_DN2531_c0_g1_i1.p1  ORF type:complete len:301 (+),score=27.19 TRINITY_DN2531_c0_g1_i1:74-976(+)
MASVATQVICNAAGLAHRVSSDPSVSGRTAVARLSGSHARSSWGEAEKRPSAVQSSMGGATEEATYTPRFKPLETQSFLKDSFPRVPQAPSRTVVPNDRADDVTLSNPLKRLERLSCGWLAVLLEWEGVVVDDDSAYERQAWTALAEEEGRPQPPMFILKRAEGMKNEQVIREVLCWSRDFLTVKRLAERKEQLYEQAQGGCYRLRAGSREFLEALKKFNIPIAIVSTRPAKYLERAIEAVGMEGFFDGVVTAEDVQRGKPDPEMYQYAAQCLQFIPERCIVIGSSNSSVEAGHDAYMKV